MHKRQRYCARPTCIKASRGAAQKKWLRKAENRDQFKGSENLVRVQDWRTIHPGYWRKRTRLGRYILRGKLAEVVREFALQDEIASEIRRLILLGHDILNQTAQAPAASRESGQRP